MSKKPEPFRESVVLSDTKFNPDPELARSVIEVVNRIVRGPVEIYESFPYLQPERAQEIIEQCYANKRVYDEITSDHNKQGFVFYDNVNVPDFFTQPTNEQLDIQKAFGLENILLDGRTINDGKPLTDTPTLMGVYLRDRSKHLPYIEPLGSDESEEQ